ncbi:hypothetical protein [Methylobacterium sp. V23]|uniref:hypothetical protein n=1 Tax=Methylobacterium sp. V23 TaxID=2044878 RepID=UPI0011B0B758|nr:hypothetical protein [Methylobacterium sp. V23]
MVALGAMPVDADWLGLRREWIHASNAIASAVRPTLLDEMPTGKEVDRLMLAAQAELKGRINSVWAEKARISAKTAVIERHRRGQANLFGRLRHVGTVGDVPCGDGTRRLVNLPEEWSRRLSDADVGALKALADSLDFAGAMSLLRKVRDGRSNLPPLHAEALMAMVAVVEERFRHPEWGRDAEAVVQLHLDYRCLPKGESGSNKEAWTALQDRMTNAVRSVARGGEPVAIPLLVAAPVARGPCKLVRAVVRQAPLKHLLRNEDVDAFAMGSLCLEIGPCSVTVKGVLSHRPKVRPLEAATHLLGRDYGYRNTAAFAVVRKDGPVDPGLLAASAEWGKEEAKAYLETHAHDGEPVETALMDGGDFLKAVAGHALRVDALRSEIDRAYPRIHALKANVNARLGAEPDSLVDLGMVTEDRHLAGWTRRLARLLAYVGRLKLERRGVYRTVEGLKRSWFGHVSGIEMRLALKWDAAVVREDLTVVAEEKGSPGYKGRTFSRMMNDGAKGQYIRRASNKLRWNGVREVVVPSYWTSCTDVRNGVVDRAQRRGSVFEAKADGRRGDSDLHAALTLALWPILRPLAAPRVALAA